MSSRGLADGALAPYEAIVEHAELELELAGAGDLDGLTALGARWEQLESELPAHPPAAAGPLLERARLVHERTRIELLRLNEALLADLGTTSRARRTADGYAGQLLRRPRLNRTA
ncbi:MAG TPA: hypothetical protein VN892_14210 [Solirubrobacteraceae bacterium]|nr:hypothetical protein [Solirubrobacteraceae bacterium]